MRPSSTLSLAALCAGLAATPLAAQNVFTLDELVFSASLQPVYQNRTGVTVRTLSQEAVRESGKLQFSETLTALPSINIYQNGGLGSNTSMTIRGLGQAYIPVFLNGIEITDPSSTQTNYQFGKLTNAAINNVEVLYGSQSAIIGDSAIAGAIMLNTLTIPDNSDQSASISSSVGSYGFEQVNLMLAQKFENLGFALNLGRTETDGFSSADNINGHTEKDGFETLDLDFTAEYYLNDNSTAGVTYLSRDSYVEFDSYDPSTQLEGDGSRWSDNRLEGFRLFAKSTFAVSDHEISYSNMNNTRYDPTAPSYERNLFVGRREACNYLSNVSVGNHNSINFLFNYEDESYLSVGSSSSAISASVNTSTFASEWLSEWAWGDITVSASSVEHSDFGRNNDYRVSANVRLDERMTLQLSQSTGYRAPSMNELYGPFGANSALKPEQSLTQEMSIAYDDSTVSAMVTVFQTKISSLISYQGTYTSPSTACANPYYGGCYEQITGSSGSEGFELGLGFQINSNTSINANYTYLEAYKASGERLQLVPRHDVAIEASWAPLTNTTLTANLQSVQDRIDNKGILEDYTIVGLGITRELPGQAQLFFNAENIFDQHYQEKRGYGTSGRAFSLGIRAEF